MGLGDTIRLTRRKVLCTQEGFAKQLNVALSTINRWELNKAKPNMKAMRAIKAIKAFCNDYILAGEQLRALINQPAKFKR